MLRELAMMPLWTTIDSAYLSFTRPPCVWYETASTKFVHLYYFPPAIQIKFIEWRAAADLMAVCIAHWAFSTALIFSAFLHPSIDFRFLSIFSTIRFYSFRRYMRIYNGSILWSSSLIFQTNLWNISKLCNPTCSWSNFRHILTKYIQIYNRYLFLIKRPVELDCCR